MLTTVAISLGLMLSACSVGAIQGFGDDDSDAASGDPRSGTFAQEVLPLATATGCLNAGCHGGIQNPQLGSFVLMTTNGLPGRYTSTPAASNILITKDQATPGTHPTAANPYFNATEKAALSTWLESAP